MVKHIIRLQNVFNFLKITRQLSTASSVPDNERGYHFHIHFLCMEDLMSMCDFH